MSCADGVFGNCSAQTAPGRSTARRPPHRLPHHDTPAKLRSQRASQAAPPLTRTPSPGPPQPPWARIRKPLELREWITRLVGAAVRSWPRRSWATFSHGGHRQVPPRRQLARPAWQPSQYVVRAGQMAAEGEQLMAWVRAC
jgi:hypothetical protein